MGWGPQDRVEDSRPDSFDPVFDSNSGRKGWLSGQEAVPEEARQVLEAAEAQKSLAMHGRWVGVLDAWHQDGVVSVVFQPQEYSVKWLMGMHVAPRPVDLSSFAQGVVNALIQLRNSHHRAFGDLRPSNVFFPAGKEGKADLGRPMLCRLPTASALAKRLPHDTDAHALGLLLYNFVRASSTPVSKDTLRMPDDSPFWPRASRSLDKAWRRFVGDLIEGKYDDRPLEDVLSAILSLKPVLQPWILVALVVFTVVAVGGVLMFLRHGHGAPQQAATPPAVNPGQPTLPAAPALLSGNLVSKLKDAVRQRPGGFYPKLEPAISMLDAKGVSNATDLNRFSSDLAFWWNDRAWTNDLRRIGMGPENLAWPANLAALLKTAGNLQVSVPSPQATNSSLADLLVKEFEKRERLTNTVDTLATLAGLWQTSVSNIIAAKPVAAWQDLTITNGLGVKAKTLAVREFARNADAGVPRQDVTQWTTFLRNTPPGPFANFTLAPGVVPLLNQFFPSSSAQGRALLSRLQLILSGDRSGDLPAWVREASDAARANRPKLFTEPRFSPDPNALEAEVKRTLGWLDPIPSLTDETKTIRSALEKLPDALDRLRETVEKGSTADDAPVREYAEYVRNFENATNRLIAALSRDVPRIQQEFLAQDRPNPTELVARLAPLASIPPLSATAAPLLTALQQAASDWPKAQAALDAGRYSAIHDASAHWNDLELRQPAFIQLMAEARKRDDLLRKFRELAEKRDSIQAQTLVDAQDAATQELLKQPPFSPLLAGLLQRLPPILAWTQPDPIAYGTPLGPGQLKAVASLKGTTVDGQLDYNPKAGAVLEAGSHTLTVTFTPADPARYSSVTTNVSLVVSPAPLLVTAGSAARPLGATNPVLAATIVGLTNGDRILPTAKSDASPDSPPGAYPAYPVLPEDIRLANYSVTKINGTLTVTNPAATQPLNDKEAFVKLITDECNLLERVVQAAKQRGRPLTYQYVNGRDVYAVINANAALKGKTESEDDIKKRANASSFREDPQIQKLLRDLHSFLKENTGDSGAGGG